LCRSGDGGDDGLRVAGGDLVTRGYDQETVGIPFTIDPALDEAEVAFDFLEFPPALLADFLDLFVEMEGFGEAEVDQNAVGVVFRPAIHDLEQVLGVFLAVFLDPLLIG
jgi:hypothetical protein